VRAESSEQLLLLAHDDLVLGLLEHLDGVQAQLVEQRADGPGRVGQALRVGAEAGGQAREHRLLERKHEGRRVARAGAALCAGRRNVGQQVARLVPRTVLDVAEFAAADRSRKRRQELLAVVACLLLRHHTAAHVLCLELCDPLFADGGLVILDQLADAGGVILRGHVFFLLSLDFG
jgi:hypothetical protein